jgi:hypothetical protein
VYFLVFTMGCKLLPQPIVAFYALPPPSFGQNSSGSNGGYRFRKAFAYERPVSAGRSAGPSGSAQGEAARARATVVKASSKRLPVKRGKGNPSVL